MKTAFLFSGQGSQSIGMGFDLYQNFSVAKDVFQEVDDTLHQDLSTLMFQGDLATLTQTQNAQPAIMAVGMAVVRVLEKELGYLISEKAALMAGHSLGEYTALCAAGALTLSETTRLLQHRGRAMADAAQKKTGGMLAILGLSIEQVQTVLTFASTPTEQTFIANDNCPGQIIVSGHSAALERVKEEAQKLGAKRVIPLAVSGAFHCPFMQKAQEQMFPLITKANITSPKCPVVSNITAHPETDPTVIKNNLIAQITGTFRWRESITYIINQGIDTFIECANGKVMAGLVRRMTGEANIISVGDSSSVTEALNFFQ